MGFKPAGPRRRGTAQHLAEQCRDDDCPRLPCRMFKAGYRKGYATARTTATPARRPGSQQGYAAGCRGAGSG